MLLLNWHKRELVEFVLLIKEWNSCFDDLAGLQSFGEILLEGIEGYRPVFPDLFEREIDDLSDTRPHSNLYKTSLLLGIFVRHQFWLILDTLIPLVSTTLVFLARSRGLL